MKKIFFIMNKLFLMLAITKGLFLYPFSNIKFDLVLISPLILFLAITLISLWRFIDEEYLKGNRI